MFRNEPIRFRTTTARALSGLPRDEQLARLSRLCLENSGSLLLALDAVHRMGIGAFRITSPLLPRFTHPEVGYRLEDLSDGREIRLLLGRAKRFARRLDIRLSFHPDQFVVLSSPREDVVKSALRELEYQGMLASLVGAEMINVHGGGVYGDKEAALSRFETAFRLLSRKVRSRLTVENDEKSYTVRDLLPLCRRIGIPLVYDVHHHRCNPDGLNVEEATRQAAATWGKSGKEPWFHISSPKNGWSGDDPKPHADYIDPADFPASWRKLDITVDVEAKAKELAILKLAADLRKRRKGTPS
jgi:UV DNA damage endonuclease